MSADQLRSDVIAHDLDSVSGENAVPDCRVRSREDEDEGNDRRACCGGAVGRVYRTGDCPADQSTQHAAQGGQHHGSASKLVNDICAPEGEAHVPHGQAAVDDRLRARIRDTHATQHYSKIVWFLGQLQIQYLRRRLNGKLTARKSGTRSLRSNCAGNTDPGPVPISFCTDKIEPIAAAMLFLERKRSLYLPKLKIC